MTDVTRRLFMHAASVAAAAGIALINSVANIGGIVAPTIVGRFGIGSMAAFMLEGAAAAWIAWSLLERPTLLRATPQEHRHDA